MRISDWSSDACSSDLRGSSVRRPREPARRAGRSCEFRPSLWSAAPRTGGPAPSAPYIGGNAARFKGAKSRRSIWGRERSVAYRSNTSQRLRTDQKERRSEEHTSELQSLMRISYAVFCLKKKKKQ